MVDGHLHFQDEGVASLFENSKELLAEVIEEELKVRATVPAATKGIPGWYTKVAFHSEWIQCIVRTSKSLTKTVDIKKSCEDSTIKPKKCQEIETEDLIFGDQRSVEDDFCNEDGTFALFV